MCKHCEHVWIAVSCSVKLFPNLEAAGLGVFNRVLTELSLWNNSIGDEGAIAIAEALKVNAVLTELDLEYNRMGDAHAGKKAVRDAV